MITLEDGTKADVDKEAFERLKYYIKQENPRWITIATVKDIKKWIAKCNSLHSLQSIRAKTNKRIKSITQRVEESPFKHISIEEKRKVLEPLFVN